MGKSFEIRPTGVAHAELLLPEERAPDYPKAKGAFLAGKVVEHYSWKKVTTNISGFILGSPTIDHYGDMIVSVVLLLAIESRILIFYLSRRSRIIGQEINASLPSNPEDGAVETPMKSQATSWTSEEPSPTKSQDDGTANSSHVKSGQV